MATTTQETQKIGAEETKNDPNMALANLPVEEDKKGQEVGPTKEDSVQVKKESKTNPTISEKNDSEDSEETGFEIIATDAEENTNYAQIKLDSGIKEEGVEPIGSIKNIDANKEIPVSSDTKDEEPEAIQAKQGLDADSIDDKIQKVIESPEASLIDIKIIKESEDNSNKDSPESETQSSEELEVALSAMPDLSTSVSKEILAKANEDEVKNIVEEIETKTEKRPEGTLVDITIIEETNKDENVQDVITEAEHSFEAEVIEDNADIQVVPSDDEDVIEYTIEARDAVPIITILVAFVAIFVALIFYYN